MKKVWDGLKDVAGQVASSDAGGIDSTPRVRPMTEAEAPDPTAKRGGVESAADADEQHRSSFTLEVDAGTYIATGEVVVLLGENGTGKSTFLDLLGSWLLHGDRPCDTGSAGDQNRNTGKGAENLTEARGLVAVKRQHPLDRARRLWAGSVGSFLDISPAALMVHDRVSGRLLLGWFRLVCTRAHSCRSIVYPLCTCILNSAGNVARDDIHTLTHSNAPLDVSSSCSEATSG